MGYAMFVQGSSAKFLSALKIPYGDLILEGHVTIRLTAMEGVEALLQNAVRQEFITSDQATELERQIRGMGLFQDSKAIAAKIRSIEVTAAPNPRFRFEICKNDGLHGTIFDEAANDETEVGTFVDAVKACGKFMGKRKHINTGDLVSMLHAALEAKLPLDEKDASDRIKALPAEEQEKLFHKMSGSLLGLLFGLDHVFGEALKSEAGK